MLQINLERVGTFSLAAEGGYRDVALLDHCDSAVARVCVLCHWELPGTAPLISGAGKTEPKERGTKTSVASDSTSKCH